MDWDAGVLPRRKAAATYRPFEKANIFSGDSSMGIFILIAGMIMVIAGVVTLIGLYRLNRFGFGD
jgi:hypothetical protein